MSTQNLIHMIKIRLGQLYKDGEEKNILEISRLEMRLSELV